MSKHTPGKWEVMQPVDTRDGYARFVRTDRKGVIVECIHDFTVGKTESEANARFVVTACNNFDEMLETLKANRSYIAASCPDAYGAKTVIGKLDALIAKIDGQTP